MATFLELKNRVLANVIDLPASVTAAVPRLINNAIRSMQREYNYLPYEDSAIFTTVVGSLALGSIANFKELKDEVPYIFKRYGKGFPITVSPLSETAKAVLLNSDYPGHPEIVFFSISPSTGDVSFFVAPYPDTNSDWDGGNYQIVIPYHRYAPALVADSDTNWFTLNADDYIEYQASAEGFQMDWDNNSAALWLQRADVKKKEVKKADKMRRLGSVQSLVPMWRGANQPKVRW